MIALESFLINVSEEWSFIERRARIGFHSNMARKTVQKSELLSLANIGPAALKDLNRCGITQIEQLAKREPTELYQQLCTVTQQRHDPCVWDVFAAAIYEAQTGEKTKWWAWTKKRGSLRPVGG